MSDILRLFFVITLLTAGLAAYFLAMNALFAERVANIKSIVQTMPGRSFGIGLVNFVFFAVIALVLLTLSDGSANRVPEVLRVILFIPAIIILAFLGILLSFGLAGMSNLLGERIFPDLFGWKQTLWGTVCLSFACAVPFVGWLLLLPYVGFVGIGGVIL